MWACSSAKNGAATQVKIIKKKFFLYLWSLTFGTGQKSGTQRCLAQLYAAVLKNIVWLFWIYQQKKAGFAQKTQQILQIHSEKLTLSCQSECNLASGLSLAQFS